VDSDARKTLDFSRTLWFDLYFKVDGRPGNRREKDISTRQYFSQKNTRFPHSDED